MLLDSGLTASCCIVHGVLIHVPLLPQKVNSATGTAPFWRWRCEQFLDLRVEVVLVVTPLPSLCIVSVAQRHVEDLKQALHASEVQLDVAVRSAVTAETARCQTEVDSANNSVRVVNEELSRTKAQAADSKAQWERRSEEDRRSWSDATLAVREELAAVQAELARTKADAEKASIFFEDSKRSLIQYETHGIVCLYRCAFIAAIRSCRGCMRV